jgi:hypothetical protein
VTKRVLVVIVAETRASALTFDLFRRNVLEPLNADLALCVGDNQREVPNPFYDAAKYVWVARESGDWANGFDQLANGSDWRYLLQIKGNWLGGIKHPTLEQPGVGAIPIFFREFLRIQLEREEIASKYDWIIVTRSDFMWTLPYPDIDLFSQNSVYFPDGEWYGGYTDRHVMIPHELLAAVMDVTKDVFKAPRELRDRMLSKGPVDWNTEQFIWFRFAELGLKRRVKFFPYAMFTVREEGGQTSWSTGDYNLEYRCYVKYHRELVSTKIVQALITDRKDWRRLIGRRRFVNWRWYLYAFLRGYFQDGNPPAVTFRHSMKRFLRFCHFVFGLEPFFILREWPGALVRKPKLLPRPFLARLPPWSRL